MSLNLYVIDTSIRTAYIWVHGYKRSACVAYHRAKGEVVYAIYRAN